MGGKQGKKRRRMKEIPSPPRSHPGDAALWGTGRASGVKRVRFRLDPPLKVLCDLGQVA